MTEEDSDRMLAMRAHGVPPKEIAEAIGVSYSHVMRTLPGRMSKGDNAAAREAFEASGRSASSVAKALGWMSGSSHRGDASRVLRTLGLKPERNGAGRESIRRLVDVEILERIADALGVDRWQLTAAVEDLPYRCPYCVDRQRDPCPHGERHPLDQRGVRLVGTAKEHVLLGRVLPEDDD